MSWGLALVLVLVALLVGTLAARAFAPKPTVDTDLLEAERQKLLDAARGEAEQLRKQADLQGKEALLKVQEKAQSEIRSRKGELDRHRAELEKREEAILRRGAELEKRDEEVRKQERAVASREQSSEANARKADELLAEAKQRLEAIAGLTADQAREKLQAEVIDAARKGAAGEVKRIEEEAKTEAESRSKRIIATAIQRYASDYVAERTVSVVPLPSDDLKGRIIGREGRNIRALEAATGIDLIIDDTPEAVVVSCFNPQRREVARLALARLIADGRIHPTRIEEVVGKCEQEVEQQIKEAGDQAVFDLGLGRVHPELVKLVGSLKFRTTFAHNLLQHSVEVGYLAGLIAAELGANVKLARRAGLLHDIGRAADQEAEGSHAAVGAQLAKRYGESPKIAQAIACHHDDEEPQSLLDHIVHAANTLSSQRPGARREALQSYIQRLEELEKLCRSYDGVERAYALQMGKEVRVLVDAARVPDEQTGTLSREIARRIEDTLSYPGQVRVSVVRETRATDYAR